MDLGQERAQSLLLHRLLMLKMLRDERRLRRQQLVQQDRLVAEHFGQVCHEI